MISLLVATPMLDRGGPDRVLFEILRRIDRTRFAPSLLVSQPTGHYLSRLPADIPVTTLGADRSMLDRYPVLPAVRHIRRTRPRVVLATLRMNMTLGLAAPLLPRETRLVLRPASPVSADMAALVATSPIKLRLARHLLLQSMRQADAIICQSVALQRDLAAVVDPAKLRVVGNPIDVDEIAAMADKPAALRGAPALVSVGRLVALKGYDIALRALAILRASHPGVHLTIIGDGPLRGELEALARDLSVNEHVTFAGYSHDPLPLVCAAKLFVLPSRYDAFCNATLEALACGTPIVVTDCPGANAELVREGVNGRLVPTLAPADVAVGIRRALADDYNRAAIQADCRVRFASAEVVKRYEDILTDISQS